MITAAHPLVRRSTGTHRRKQSAPSDRVPAPWEPALHHLTWSLVHFGVLHRYELQVQGTEHFPTKGPAVIVANHGSHLDTLLIGSAVPSAIRSRLSPLAAGDTFFRNAMQSWLSSRFLNLRPLWRHQSSPHALHHLRHQLANHDDCLLVFPEGTRSRDGSMHHFKAGIGMLVAGTDIPVIPCHIQGTHDAWPPGKSLPSTGSLRLSVGPARTFPSLPNNSDAWRAIARQLEREVRKLGGLH